MNMVTGMIKVKNFRKEKAIFKFHNLSALLNTNMY